MSQQQPDYPSAADFEAMRLEFEMNLPLEVGEDPERPPSRTGGAAPVAVGVLVGVLTGGLLVLLVSLFMPPPAGLVIPIGMMAGFMVGSLVGERVNISRAARSAKRTP